MANVQCPMAKTLGACGPSGFGLGTSLGTTFTLKPPQLIQIMSHSWGYSVHSWGYSVYSWGYSVHSWGYSVHSSQWAHLSPQAVEYILSLGSPRSQPQSQISRVELARPARHSLTNHLLFNLTAFLFYAFTETICYVKPLIPELRGWLGD